MKPRVTQVNTPTCDAPCPYGGRWAARKWSKTDLGAWNHCNRRVKNEGDRCWQHRVTHPCPES